MVMTASLVILPGLICNEAMFAAQLDAFGGLVIGGFYGGADRITTMAHYAIDRMPDGCALLGHSMGARVALEVWRLAPEKVSRLALADTGVHAPRAGEADKRYALRDLGRRLGADALVDAWLPPMIGKGHRDDPHLLTELHAMATSAGVPVFEAQIEALIHRPDALQILPTITCPTFAIVGRDDHWSPIGQHEKIVSSVPGAQLRVVENAGHMAPAEEPDRFNDAVREWLSWPS